MKRWIHASEDESEKRYSAIAYLYDKRANEQCRIKTYSSDDYDEIKQWASKIKRAWGDSVKVIDNQGDPSDKSLWISLRDDQIVM